MSDVSSEDCSGKGRKIHVKAVLEERQRAAYIQNQEMQISQKLAEMFKLVLNTLEAKAGNYRQTCFVWLAQCFKQSWIRCQHIKIGSFFFFFLILSFPWKLEEQEKPATWQHCAELGGSCPPLASHIFLGSPWGPAACFMHQILPDPGGICISCTSFKQLRPKVSLSVLYSNSNSCYKDAFLPWRCYKRNQIIPANHLEITVEFMSLAVHRNHLGSFIKKTKKADV